MSSWKSSSSKGLFDPDAMLELEDQLDYEPDGGEHDSESDSDDDSLIQEYDPSNQERKQDNKEKTDAYSQDEDSGHQFPEPSGQEDPEASDQSSSEQSLTYGTDLEKAPSITPSYRDKINYNNLHIDVEKGSYRSKFGRHFSVSESFHLDSSDDEEELEDTETASVPAGIQNDYQSPFNFNGKIASNREKSYLRLAAQQETEPPSYEDYYASSENSQTYENMVSPKEVIGVSSDSGATTPRVDHGKVSPDFAQATSRNAQRSKFAQKNSAEKDSSAVLPQRERTSLNFSIKVVGNRRTYLVPKSSGIKRKSHKPWLSRITNYMDNSIVKLTSTDEVIGFLPEGQTSGIKNRLGDYSADRDSPASESGSLLSLFKVPLKRPPTRQRSTCNNLSVSIDLKSQERIVGDMASVDTANHQDDKDDIISLMASSCHLSIADDLEEARGRHSFIKEEPLSLTGSSTGTDRAKIERTAQWVSKAIEPSKTPVPAIYRGLCYNYFLQNKCNNRMCIRSHLLQTPQTQIKNLPFLNIDLLMEAYQFAKEHPFLYGQIYKHFAEVFALKDMKHELINMVHIIFDESSHKIDQEEGLNAVLSALQKTNLTTFEDTVEFLLLQIGLKLYINLGNVLLEIICKKPDVVLHWPIVRRLIIAGEKINGKLGATFLIHLMKSPVNLKVCQEVYRYILKYKCLDLHQISNATRDQFLKICSEEDIERETAEIEANVERNLRKERFNFERTVQNNTEYFNLPIQQDFSVPPPTIGAGRTQVPLSLNYQSPTVFGDSQDHQLDFASFNLPDKSFPAQPNNFSCPPPTFEAPSWPNVDDDRRSKSRSLHDVDLRYRLPETGEHKYSVHESSDDDQSPSRPRFTDSDSSIDQSPTYFHPALLSPGGKKRRAPTVFTHNVKGYDPANDFLLPSKKQRTGTRTEFDLLKLSSNARGSFDDVQTTVQTFHRTQHGDQGAGRAAESVRSSNGRAGKRWIDFSARGNDATVSSSSDAKLMDEKPPEHPQFGDLYFDPHYEFNVSLHNLYLQAIDNIDIDADDVYRLNDCVKQSDGKTFLTLVEKYKGPKTVQNFISMTLANLKGMNQMVAKTYQGLLDTIEEENPCFYGNVYIRVILEVITLNLLFELFQRHMIEAADKFLSKFSNWDSLVTSRLFINSSTKEVSIIGRYLFIAKILIGRKPELTYEILVCPKLHLLEKYEVWPYFPPCPIPEIFCADLKERNTVIVNFLRQGYLLNTVGVIQLYKTAFRKAIFELDVKPYVDPMVIDLINRDSTLPLKQINNEINLFHEHMRKDTLRAFLISVYKHVSERDSFFLYDKCAERNIYHRFARGDSLEYTLEIKTDMHVCEIELIIKYYFDKLAVIKKVPSGSEPLRFEIKLPGESRSKSIPLLNNNNKSLIQTNQILTHLLKKLCSVECQSVMPSVVEVQKEELVNYLDKLWT